MGKRLSKVFLVILFMFFVILYLSYSMFFITDSFASGKNYTHDIDVELLAKLIYAEGRETSYNGQVAIGAIVLNRIRHSSFPNTLSSVIYQPGAFRSVSNGAINLKPNQTAINAAQDAMNGWDPTHGAIYYYNPEITKNEWISSRTHIVTIDNYKFYK